jgi:lipopolysaccharide heptosyltransferase II
MEKILIFNPFGIGDVLFTTPLIRNIKEVIPEVRIYYLCNRRTYPLLKVNNFLERVYLFEKDEWREILKKSKPAFFKKTVSFFQELKKENFDTIFDLSLNSSYGAFFKLLGIKRRIGFNFKNRGIFLTHRKDLPSGYKDKHVADYYLELLDFLDIKPKRFKFDLFLKEEDLRRAERILNNLGMSREDLLVGICPGSGDSWQDTAYFKRWPKDNFSKLCDLLFKKLDAKVILFGSNSEKELGDYTLENTKYKPLNLCGKTSLIDFVSLLSFCKLLITNDGGPLHIAQSLGIKTAVLFGPVDDLVYGTYPDKEGVIVLKRDLSCRPCYQEFKFKGCNYDKRCLREITVKEVFQASKNLLSEA